MFRMTPYNKTLRSDERGYRDVFDLFDDFFAERDYGYRKFKLDVRDTNDTYIIDADLPGVEKDNISIHFEDEQLVISVEAKETTEEENETYIHRERHNASYERRINLKDVDPSKFKASLKDGVLSIHAPKLEEKVNKYMIDIE